ncbi:unnamed protein product [marine sediment metagenome]|uniref:Uncharacterized protein n=1 Tax=marine sediment metagenome TaxID=412755 RepID=X0U9N3_9ZZZZ
MGVAIAGAVIGTVGLISSFLGSRKASKAAKKEAKEQARLEGLLTNEQLRRLKIDERTMYGKTLAGFASGGVQATAPTLGGEARVQTGSPQAVMQEQASEFAQERQITSDVGATKVSQSLTRGKNVANAYKWQGYSNMASGISGILAGFG